MNKIYIAGIYTGSNSYGVIRDAGIDGDIMGYAIYNGEVIQCHFSSGLTWLKHDMGLTSDWYHDRYKEVCGDDYELVFVGTFNSEQEFEKWFDKLEQGESK